MTDSKAVRVLLIVNNAASSVTARVRVLVQQALAENHDVSVAETRRRGHAIRLAQGAAADAVDLVAVLGGDGTLNEAANGLAGTQTALAALPGGSTNVFARTIGLPNDAIAATELTVAAIDRDAIRSVGLGSVNGRSFLFHAGVGFDAAVVERVERHGSAKRYFGHPLFVWATIVTWFRGYDRCRPHFALVGPRSPVTQAPAWSVPDGFFTIVLNTNPYTFLGNRPLDITPDAGLDRALAAVTLRSLRLDHLGRVALETLRSSDGLGTAPADGAETGPRRNDGAGRPDLRSDLHRFVIESIDPFPYQVDGDYLGEVRRLEFRYQPDRLRLVQPA